MGFQKKPLQGREGGCESLAGCKASRSPGLLWKDFHVLQTGWQILLRTSIVGFLPQRPILGQLSLTYSNDCSPSTSAINEWWGRSRGKNRLIRLSLFLLCQSGEEHNVQLRTDSEWRRRPSNLQKAHVGEAETCPHWFLGQECGASLGEHYSRIDTNSDKASRDKMHLHAIKGRD